MKENTNIALKMSTKEKMDKLKLVPNETYDHLINRMIEKMSR